MWTLKKDGSVHQYAISFERDEEMDQPTNFKVSEKKRQITSLSNIKQIACGLDHFVALDNEGRVFTMGDDTLGQCGIGEEGRANAGPFFERRIPNPRLVQSKPPLSDLGKVTKVSCGSEHTLALTEDGGVVGWGSNKHLQLSHEREHATADNPLLVSFSPLRIDRSKPRSKQT